MSFTPSDIKTLREKTGAGMMDCKKALEETGDIDKAVDWLRKKGVNTAQKKSSRSASDGLITIQTNDESGVIIEINSETDFVAKNENFQDFSLKIALHCLKNKISSIEILNSSKLETGISVKEELTNIIAKLGENIVIKRLNLLVQEDKFFQKYLHNSVSLNSGKMGVLMCYSADKTTNNTEEFSKQITMHIAATEPKSIDIDSLDKKLISKEKEIFSEQLKSSGKPDNIIEKIVEGKVSKFLDEVCLLEQYYVMDNKKKVKDVISEFNNSNNNNFKIQEYFLYKLGS